MAQLASLLPAAPLRAGRRKSVCPYYAARRALPEADIVLAPYSCLLARETRQALGLRLEGNVVIVDEGHNLGEPLCKAGGQSC